MKTLKGIIAAAVTPIKQDLTPDEENLSALLSFLAEHGCHGALLMGTTGEGPSFSLSQRRNILRAAAAFRATNSDFILLAGTGMTSLADTIQVSRYALEIGFDGVVVLPPYYYKSLSVEALYAWYSTILEQAVPPDKWLLGYHFPRMTGVPLTQDLLQKLAGDYPGQFVGVKDSSGDAEHLESLLSALPSDFAIFPGNDRLLSLGLRKGAAGSISSLANLGAGLSRRIWDNIQAGEPDSPLQPILDDLRQILDQHPPAPAFLKAVMPHLFELPQWQVYPPLTPLSEQQIAVILSQIEDSPASSWLQMQYGPTA